MPNAAPTHRGKWQQAKPRTTKSGDPFYSSWKWLRLRRAVLGRDCWKCADCGKYCTDKGDAHVDHIEERKANPARAYDIDNLQTLCASCHGRKTRSAARVY